MTLIDSDVFLIDKFYIRDTRFGVNREFLDEVLNKKTCTTIYNLLEICGILSHNLSKKELMQFFEDFQKTYKIKILFPNLDMHGEEFHKKLVQGVFDNISLKMSFGDALILWTAKHFAGKSEFECLTPAEYLKKRKKKVK